MTALIQTVRNRPYLLWGLLGLVTIVGFLTLGVLVRALPTRLLFSWQVFSGLILTLAIVYQWVLLFVRLSGAKTNVLRHYKAHRWVGVAATFFFAFHAVSFGYAWTNALAIMFWLSALTGLLNKEIVRYRDDRTYNLWFFAHLTLSISLLPLVAVHIWIALAYEGF